MVFVAAVSYQFLLNKKGGLLMSSPKNLISGGVRAPGFEGGTGWIKSQPLELIKLMAENKLVLVDFWTYSCINCQRTIPYLKQWWEKYQDKGLVIVGVHSPEFEFEKKAENVISAMEKYGVTWPVVQDNEFKIWRAYANNYWPAKYLVMPPGEIIYSHFGEGAYAETEALIRDSLTKLGYKLDQTKVAEVPEPGVRGGISPETYLGYMRGRFGNGEQIKQNVSSIYEIDGQLMGDLAYLLGEWTVFEEYALAGQGAQISYKFTAGEVNLVMRGEGKRVKVYIDGQPIKEVVIKESDLYNLYKGERKTAVLRLEFEAGVEAYAFTFGN